MINLLNKKILITDETDFFGRFVTKQLMSMGVKNLFRPNKQNFDFRKLDDCVKVTKNIDIVIHTAGNTGGIIFNKNFPGTAFYDNLLIGTQLMEASRISGVKKFVALGTVSCYPKLTPTPFRESDIWNGYPDQTNAPYGLAKKMLLVQSQAYRQQYGFNSIFLIPANPYGPEDYDEGKNSHVIPALIRRFLDAKKKKESKVTVWGSGKATREFIYIEDAARAIVMATERYDKSDPVNVGSGLEVSIKDLAETIARLIKYKGEICWDQSKPDGQPRRSLNIKLAQKEFGFRAKINFEEGLKKTIQFSKQLHRLN